MGRCLLVLLLVTAVRPLEAQRLTAELPRLSEVSFRADRLDLEKHRAWKAPDYRYEGLAMGAGVGLVVGILAGSAICSQSDVSCTTLIPLTALSGVGFFGFIGLMVGGGFDKPRAEDPPTPTDSLPS
jgi:hypothetical protein